VQRDSRKGIERQHRQGIRKSSGYRAPLSLKTKWHGEALMIRNAKRFGAQSAQK